MITHIILNRIVEVAVKRDPELAAAFFAIHHGYDDEIDALHRESTIDRFRDDEIRKLDKAQCAVDRAREFINKNKSQGDFACVTGTHEV
jgi:hypothetical protein